MNTDGPTILDKIRQGESPLMIHQELMESKSISDLQILRDESAKLINEEYRGKLIRNKKPVSIKRKILFGLGKQHRNPGRRI